MDRKILYSLIALLAATAMILSSCGSIATPVTIVETKAEETQVVATIMPELPKKQLEIFHWWTAPGERQAADAMFAAFNTAYPDIEIVENPIEGGGGTEHTVVLKNVLRLVYHLIRSQL